jgi:hypothetical protein
MVYVGEERGSQAVFRERYKRRPLGRSWLSWNIIKMNPQ